LSRLREIFPQALEERLKHVAPQNIAGEFTRPDDLHQPHHILTVAVTLLHVAIAIATIAIIVRGQRWPWYTALALGAVGSIGAAQHRDLVGKPNPVFLGRRVVAGRAGARTRQ
jgi:hypothetical protein